MMSDGKRCPDPKKVPRQNATTVPPGLLQRQIFLAYLQLIIRYIFCELIVLSLSYIYSAACQVPRQATADVLIHIPVLPGPSAKRVFTATSHALGLSGDQIAT